MPGKNYYRLLSIGTDGHAEVSPVVGLDYQESLRDMQVWPNPVREKLFISVEAGAHQALQSRIFDVAGNIVAEQLELEAGVHSIWTGGWKQGVYFLEVFDGSGFRRRASIVKTD